MNIIRIIVGFVLVVVLTGILALDHFTHTLYGITALLFLITVAGLYEFYTLHEKKHETKLPKIYGMLIGALLIILYWRQYIRLNDINIYLIIMGSAGVLILWYILRGSPENVNKIYIFLFGLCYISLPLLFIYSLRRCPLFGESAFLFFLIVNKGADTGAYFAGTFLGKHKLVPKVSPNKTIEGLIGALLTGVLIGLLFWNFTGLGTHYTAGYFVLATVLITLGGQTGDLFMSLIKRHCGAKDSSNLLPAHGGVLDLIDSLLISGPIAFIMLTGNIIRF